MLFSSRFCNNIKYNPDLTSCSRPIDCIIRSCFGASATSVLYLLNWPAIAFLWISKLWRPVSIARRIFVLSVLIWSVSGSTTGEFTDALRRRRFLSNTNSLYLLIRPDVVGSVKPMLEGITCEKSLEELLTSEATLLKSWIWVSISVSFCSDAVWFEKLLAAFICCSTIPFCCL